MTETEQKLSLSLKNGAKKDWANYKSVILTWKLGRFGTCHKLILVYDLDSKVVTTKSQYKYVEMV